MEDIYEDVGTAAERVNVLIRVVRAHDATINSLAGTAQQIQAIHTALLGTYEKSGLCDRVRDLEKKRRKTPEWLEHAFKAASATAMLWLGMKGN